ncbi:HepT-like ribonuclease domain-containing protein [Larkinella arboricola]|uniref:HepT-like ribonuclease domain-containing protein n=1 Tax=Larkinella arboricola TaxID=643671 RepID=UPI000DB9447D
MCGAHHFIQGNERRKVCDPVVKTICSIPWQQIKAFRNVVAHDYIGVDKLIVFETIRDRLPHLQQQLEHLIREMLKAGVFDQTEYQISKASTYYKHIDFDTIV